MSQIDFADRYAEAGLKPSAEIIAFRQASAARIQENANKEQVLDLVCACFGLTPDLEWFRDELRQEDQTFSLVTNQRESAVIAAAILNAKVAEGDATAILGLVAGSIEGRRAPIEAQWLLDAALSAISEVASKARVPREFKSPIRHSATQKLTEEIAAAGGDPAALSQVLAKVRSESQESARTVAKQATDALHVLSDNTRYLREESQILWWLFGEHSRALGKPFAAFRPAQAALVAGLELGELTIASELGPVAAPAVLLRVLRSAKKDTKAQPITLISAIDGLGSDLAKLRPDPPVRAEICPVLTALQQAKKIGFGSWSHAFQTSAKISAEIEFEAIELARQVYHEHLLGLV